MNIVELALSRLQCCGCGSPKKTLDALKGILEIINSKRDSKDREKEIAKFLGVDRLNDNLYGLYQFMLYQLDDLLFLEHGYIIGNAWLTDRGHMLLQLLNIITKEDYEKREDETEYERYYN